MPEAKKEDSKQEEAQTSSEQSAEKKESGTEGDTSQKTYTEEEIKKLEKKATDFDNLIIKLATEKKDEKRSAEFKAEQKPQDDSGSVSDFEAEQRKIAREEIARVESQKTEQNFNNALDKFVRQHPEYSPENDVLDVNWKKIKVHVDELKNGVYKGSEEGYLERLNLIHNGITKEVKSEKSESDTEKVEDSGVGNITSQSKTKEVKPDALTRPLNKFEHQHMLEFPGKTLEEKEKGYREKLAKLEAERKARKER